MDHKAIDFEAVAAAFATPFYFYDLDGARARARTIRSQLPARVKLFYCPKANPNRDVLHALSSSVDGLDVSSIGEVRLGQQSGYQPTAMSFAGPGKTDAALAEAVDRRVGIISVESAAELRRLTKIAERAGRRITVTLRINPLQPVPHFAMRMGGQPSPFGIPEECAESIVAEALRCDAIDVAGLHVYAGTQCLDAAAIAEGVKQTIRMSSQLAASTGLQIRLLNVGGGVGVPYFENELAVDPVEMSAALFAAFKTADDFPEFNHTEFIVELGRYLIGEFGTYVARVVDVKQTRGKRFAILDGGMHHCFAATGNFGQLIKKNFHILNLSRPSAPLLPYDVVGPLCTPLDTVARTAQLPEVQTGDLLGIANCGAYGLTASPISFLAHDPPAEVIRLGGDVVIPQGR